MPVVPTGTPATTASPEPTAEPTPTPTVKPTAAPTPTPTVKPTVRPTARPTPAPTTVAFTLYTVKSGDTLFGIATSNGSTVAAIKSLNGLIDNTIYVGQILKIPTP